MREIVICCRLNVVVIEDCEAQGCWLAQMKHKQVKCVFILKILVRML